MSFKVRVLDRASVNDDGDATYSVVVHAPTPAGVNGADLTWVSVLVYAKRNTSQLKVGAVPPNTNITQPEMDALVAGTSVEFTFNWVVGKAWPLPTREANLQSRAREEIAKQWQGIVDKYYYYGFVETYDD